jgi:nucleoside-diphosphate-sugar epimerase
MKLAVFGATGLTGGLVVSQALAQGNEVTALVRVPSRVSLSHPRLTVLGGSPTAPDDVDRCVRGADAVIHCLGIGGKGDGRPTTLVSDSVQVVLAAMAMHGVPRVVCMSNVGAGSSGTWFANRVVIPLFLRWLLPIHEDKDRMEDTLRASAVEWGAAVCLHVYLGEGLERRVETRGRGRQ